MNHTKPIEKQFAKFVIPSMFTMLLAGFYEIVDGFFVGRALGDVGLAAINIAWPLAALILAIGTGVGIGGSVIMSTFRGKGDLQQAKAAEGTTISLLALIAVCLTVILLLCARPLLIFLGAQGQTLELGLTYIRVIFAGTALQMFGTGLTPLLRNHGKSFLVMIIMVAGLITNIVLDALFIMVFQWGIFGAAFATVLAQGVTAVGGLLGIFLQKKENRPALKDLKPRWNFVGESIKIGLSPFGLSFSPSLIVIFCNWQCLRYGGEVAVAAYSVIAYVLAPAQNLMQGVGDGIQPLISFCKGGELYKSMRILIRKAVLLVLLISVVLFVAMIPGSWMLPIIFGVSSEAAAIVEHAMLIFSIAFPLIGLARLFSAYFYAVKESRFSTLLVYLDPIVLTPLFVFTLPLVLDLDGVWMAIPAAQGVLALVAVVLFLVFQKRIPSKNLKPVKVPSTHAPKVLRAVEQE